ncbi:MAG: hypothetical protein PHQ28_02235 [Mycobacterium sp.]|nr:hypothetical protein [Mycobacterium sp.]
MDQARENPNVTTVLDHNSGYERAAFDESAPHLIGAVLLSITG